MGLGWKLGPKMLDLCRPSGCNSSPPGCGVSDCAGLCSDALADCMVPLGGSRFLPQPRGLSEKPLGSAVEGKVSARLWGPCVARAVRSLPAGSGSSC